RQADKDLSIPAQLQAMRDYARQRDWKIVEEFIEPGVSAKTADRPVLQTLLTRVAVPELRIETVLVHKIDRLARNVFDYATIKALLKTRSIRLASVVENTDDSVSGQLVENIMASIAQFYSANLADEVRKGMRQKVLKGGWPHLPPRGYRQVRTKDDRGSRVELDPQQAPLMRRAFELYGQGWLSLKEVAARLAAEGLTARNGQPLATRYLHDLLCNPFYVGRVRWKELDVAGEHPALVSDELFSQVRDVMRRRFRDPGAKGSANGFPLRGLAICASCRGHMTAGWQRSTSTRRRWGYYRCSRRIYNRALCAASRGCPARLAHASIEESLGRLSLSTRMVEAILASVQALLAKRAVDTE
ncbi:MAG: recombinase family protein, partial [Bryobacteraceae bacterium]